VLPRFSPARAAGFSCSTKTLRLADDRGDVTGEPCDGLLDASTGQAAPAPCSAPASGLIDDDHDLADGATSEGGESVVDLIEGEGLLDHGAGVPGHQSVGDPSQQLRGVAITGTSVTVLLGT
jgi:hypothetical protein